MAQYNWLIHIFKASFAQMLGNSSNSIALIVKVLVNCNGFGPSPPPNHLSINLKIPSPSEEVAFKTCSILYGGDLNNLKF
jgi:hypothetical protein